MPTFGDGIIQGRLKISAGKDLLDDEALSKKIEELRRKGKIDQADGRRAKKFIIEQLIARGYKRNEIADHLGIIQ